MYTNKQNGSFETFCHRRPSKVFCYAKWYESLTMTKKIFRYLLIGFMLFAGINHLVDPDFYYPLIPDYLPFPKPINAVSGLLELLFALLLLFPKWRTFGAYGIIVLLVLFIPSHIYFIQIDACVPDGLCTPLWVAWVRLILIHPLLLFWVWKIKD